jgi:hypothetical protein
VQDRLFKEAVASRGEFIRSQLAAFLHDNHERTSDPLGDPREVKEGGEPLRTAYAVAEPNQHRAIALFKLRPDHTADEQVEAVAELTQSALDSLGLKPGMIKPL